MSHRSCLKALTELEGLHLITRQRGGRDHLFALNRDHILVTRAVLPLLEQERKFLDDLIGFIKSRLAKVTESVVLFGSVARREETVASDFDICMVVRANQEKSRAQEIAHAISPECHRRYGAQLAPLIFTVAEFKRNHRLKKSPVPEIVRHGQVIAGTPIRRLLGA